MRLLLDTHAFLWFVTNNQRLKANEDILLFWITPLCNSRMSPLVLLTDRIPNLPPNFYPT